MKLVYFNGRGLAETSRMLFAISDIEYEDFRYPLKIIDWTTHNMERKEFLEDRDNNKLVKSLNKLPYLEVDGQILSQSKAIERYLSKQFNMMGRTELETARIDAITECVRDFKTAYQTVRKLPESDKEEGMKTWFTETLPERLTLLENLLCHESNNHSVGSDLSLADVALFCFVKEFFDDKDAVWSATENCLHLRNIVQHVSENNRLQEWINTRPKTSF